MTPEATRPDRVRRLARGIHVNPGDRQCKYPVLAGSVPAIPNGLGHIWGTGGVHWTCQKKKIENIKIHKYRTLCNYSYLL